MLKYVARSYSMGAIMAEAKFTASNHEAAIRIATEELGHSKHARGERNSKVAVIGVKAI